MNKIKLLGGKFCGQDVIYYSNFIKPTIFIVRKILFSWLKDCINGSRILDLFGGTGILSFESLSRGASYVFILEKCINACNDILLNIRRLKLENVNFINIDSYKWIKSLKYIKNYVKSFDIIFIDPPYDSNYLFYFLTILNKYNYVSNNSYIYIESYINFELEFIFFNYKIIKSKTVGNVKFYIIKKI